MNVSKRSNIFKRALWFHRREKFDLEQLYDYLQPQRTVSDGLRSHSGIFYSEKCGRNIQYESDVELNFIKHHLETNPDVLFYWEQPVRATYRRGNIRASTYPDFAVYTRSRHFIIVEVKPLGYMLDHRVQAKAEGLMEFCSKRGFGLLLTDGKHTPKDLLKGRVNRKLERALFDALNRTGEVRESEYKVIKSATDAKPSELYRAIIRLDVKFYAKRLRFTRGNISPVFRQVYFGKKKYDDLGMENLGIKK